MISYSSWGQTILALHLESAFHDAEVRQFNDFINSLQASAFGAEEPIPSSGERERESALVCFIQWTTQFTFSEFF